MIFDIARTYRFEWSQTMTSPTQKARIARPTARPTAPQPYQDILLTGAAPFYFAYENNWLSWLCYDSFQ